MPGLRIATLMVCGLAAPVAAAELESQSTPHPGVTYTLYREPAIPARIHVVSIDLTASDLTLAATPQPMRGRTVSALAADTGAVIVVNGDFFTPTTFAPAGLAMGDGAVWTGSADDERSGFLRFDKNGNRTHVTISTPSAVQVPGDLPQGTLGVVGGRPLLVTGGAAVTGIACDDHIALPCQRSPRTAVGLSEDGDTLYLTVVDGWQSGSLGLDVEELASFLAEVGAHEALMLDIGSSSALYVDGEGGLVSSPSDGVERAVANHLFVHHQLPPGQMLGWVREYDIFDEDAGIVGATVMLDDGTTAVTDDEGRYSFLQVAPRHVCATASADGYRSTTRCQLVKSGQMVFNSIPLSPSSDFIDAGPGEPDAGPITFADAAPAVDGAPPAGTTDAGGGDGGGGGGGLCSAAEGPASGLIPVLLTFLATMRRRARGNEPPA